MKKWILSAALFCVAMAAHADDRITRVVYDKYRVYPVWAKVGKVILIQLEGDESLDQPATALAMGDARAWANVKARGNVVFLKPSAVHPNTNLIIVTTKRTYLFDLALAGKDQAPTYALFFRYPDTEKKEADALAAAQAGAQAAALAKAQADAATAARVQLARDTARASIRINTDFSWHGESAALAPSAAWDDGRFTHLQYNHGGAMPVFYKRMPDGSEALINGAIAPDKITMVLQDVTPVILARMGDAVIEIRNRGYALPAANVSGTSVPGLERFNK